MPGPIRLIVVRGDQRLDSILRGRAPSWGAGFALPGARTIVIRADRGNPQQILLHELAHFALRDAVRTRVPLWFDEGYASVASGEWDRLESLRLNLTVALGRVPNFFELDRALRADQASAEAAYALAASVVSLLARRHPSQSLSPLLDRLIEGEGFGEAVLATTGSPLGRFELEWQKDTRRRYGLLVWIMAGGAWALLAGLVLLAAWVRRRRDRPRRAALDQGWVIAEDEPVEEPHVAPPQDPDASKPQ
ncbi:MAG: hypothetical protein HOP28_01445 [Gemmatimonadales bacterium]|nr:hypothetical protein [Gemmatimonadales bacterium]